MTHFFLCCIRPHRGIEAECSSCEIETHFGGVMYYRTDERKFYSYEFQCQGCGVLKYSDEYSEKGKLVALKDHCECGGQFRSDKNIFCPSCDHRKSEVNKFDSKVVLTEKELEVLEKCHGE